MSSISIYREFDEDVDESFEITQSSLIKEAEDLVLSLRENVIILRLGGLMGDDRVAGRWKSAADFSDGYVNYIHKDDVINIIKKMIENIVNLGIYNLVAPLHPSRQEIHKKNSQSAGSEIGKFEGFSKRRVSSQKVIKELNYTFLHPNPLEFWD
jgi:NAD dependent epimerase/dehydratase family enzyme